MRWDEPGREPPPRRLHRRFGTRRLFQCQGPGWYVAITPLGMPLTRDGQGLAVERRRADKTMSRPSGWYPSAPPAWGLTSGYRTAKEAAQRLDRAVREYDTGRGGGLART